MNDTNNTLENDLNATRVEKESMTIYFTYIGINLTETRACELQLKKGYHPAGYGFYNLRETSEHNKIVYKWECMSYC